MQRFAVSTQGMCIVVFLLGSLGGLGCNKRDGQLNGDTQANKVSGNKVTFSIPRDWVLQQHIVQSNLESFQFLIPDSALEGTGESANAGIVIEPAEGGLTVTNFSEMRLGNIPQTGGCVVLTNMFTDGTWSTAMTRAQQGKTPYIIMDRFGVELGNTVMFRVAHPISSNNQAAIANSISNFNVVVRSLKIGDKNSVDNEMRSDHGVIWLRAFNDMDTNWMTSSTNALVYRSPLQHQ